MLGPNRQTELMSKARGKASFSWRELTYFIYGGKEAVECREAVFARVGTLLGPSDQMKLPSVYANGGRDDAYLNGLKWGKVLMDEETTYHHGIFDMASHQYALMNASPFGLHPTMFIPTLRLQASIEQQAYWLPLAEAGKIIGTYCQTELGHGTFIRGLETTATFDEENDQFIMHSPTITSTKYWPGSLGFSASHAIVIARLLIKDKDHGIHPFIVQLRSLDDWKPIPGIELGDIGLKMGLNTTDNGYAIFSHARIPRTNMLMGQAQVRRDGTYNRLGSQVSAYSTMLYVRNRIVHVVAFQLAQATTIAIRYSTVRTQGHGHYSESVLEVPILSFKSQHHRLLAVTAQSYALLFAAKSCDSVYGEVLAQQKRGDSGLLPYCHALTAGLKAYATQIAADGVEDARKCCGGHGYSLLSGLPDIVAAVTPHCTWEGENYVLYQQTARYLANCADTIKGKQPIDEAMSYLADAYNDEKTGDASRCTASGDDFLNPQVQLTIFRHRAVRLIFEADSLLTTAEQKEKRHFGNRGAWNTHMMPLISAARAHTEFFVLQAFTQHLTSISDSAIHKALSHLRNLFALIALDSTLSPSAAQFFEDGYLSLAQLRTVRAHVNDLHKQLLPDAIALTDAWNFSDASLQSALGMRDGNVYETLMAWTRQVPINVQAGEERGVYRKGWEGVIKPMLKGRGKEKL